MNCDKCSSSRLTIHALYIAGGHKPGYLLCGDCGNEQIDPTYVESHNLTGRPLVVDVPAPESVAAAEFAVKADAEKSDASARVARSGRTQTVTGDGGPQSETVVTV